MHPLHEALGTQRYADLQDRLASPAQRARHVLKVTASAWWPDGVVPVTRKAASRLAQAHGLLGHARHRRHA